jgi:ribosomal protein S18 acetylase RimI-like enzyme
VNGPIPEDVVRRARPDEGPSVAELWLRSRQASIPANPPAVHDDDEVRDYFCTEVLPNREVWVVDREGRGIVALLVLHEGWVTDLHVDPQLTGRGLGSRLVELAKARQPDVLDLWTFQSNAGARRFYERHGFVVVAMTDGDNEEKAPDVHYRWRAEDSARSGGPPAGGSAKGGRPPSAYVGNAPAPRTLAEPGGARETGHDPTRRGDHRGAR